MTASDGRMRGWKVGLPKEYAPREPDMWGRAQFLLQRVSFSKPEVQQPGQSGIVTQARSDGRAVREKRWGVPV